MCHFFFFFEFFTKSFSLTSVNELLKVVFNVQGFQIFLFPSTDILMKTRIESYSFLAGTDCVTETGNINLTETGNTPESMLLRARATA